MSEDVADRLRSLVKDYQHGRLSFPEYRRMRTALLDSLDRQAGAVAAEVSTQPRAPAPLPARPLASAPPHPSAPSPARPPTPAPARPIDVVTRKLVVSLSRSQWIGALAVGLVVVTIGAIVLLNHGERATGRVGESQRLVSADRIYEVIEPLMKSPDWGEARIASVNASLLEEGAHQITARQQTEWFQSFAAEVRRRLENQRAAGADALVPEKSALAALAVTIGLNLKDLDAPLVPPPRGGSGTTTPLPE